MEIYGIKCEPVDPKLMEEFIKVMKEDTIPAIEKTMRERQDAKWRAYIDGKIFY